jgi:cytochrome c oxidase subunit II
MRGNGACGHGRVHRSGSRRRCFTWLFRERRHPRAQTRGGAIIASIGSSTTGTRRRCRMVAAMAAALLCACGGNQSALMPAGSEATDVARLFWVMVAGAAVVWLLVIALALYAGRSRPHAPATGRRLIVIGGVVFPTVVLGALLLYGLRMMPPLRAPGAAEGLAVEVSGEQWWWRVRYLDPRRGAEGIDSANEIRLPLGERTTFRLSSPDVIHSFWIPALGGKMDMIPGRVTTLVLEPTEAGRWRGVCAEFCGASHALMAFDVEVMPRADFDRWLAGQAAPAAMPSGALERRGRAAFVATGCGACHAVRGDHGVGRGRYGPDLTHVGSRPSLAAGTLANDAPAFRAWVERTHRIKPEALMPAFDMLPADELDAMAVYLESLQ